MRIRGGRSLFDALGQGTQNSLGNLGIVEAKGGRSGDRPGFLAIVEAEQDGLYIVEDDPGVSLKSLTMGDQFLGVAAKANGVMESRA